MLLKGKAVPVLTSLAILTFVCGCHGHAGGTQPGTGIMDQTPATPQAQAKVQAQLSNPRISPQMKEMLRRHLQQSGADSAK